MTDYVIIKNPRGYYELWINGEHISNHDTEKEAKNEAEDEKGDTS